MRRRLLLVLVLTLGALVASASPALAHAELKDTTPVSGARLENAPRQVLLRFTERVEVALGGVRIFDGAGERVDRGRISHPNGDGSAVAVPLPALGDGAYIVTWRVISADNHPIQGAFSFVVGDAKPADTGDIEELLGASGGSRVLGVAYGVGRSLAFAAMLLLLGAVAFVVLAWPGGTGNRRFRRIAVVSLAVLAAATVVNLVLQGGYGSGLGLGDTLSWSVISGVLRTRFGHVYELRLALLVAAAALLWVLTRGSTLPSWWRWAAVVVGVGIAATPGLAGHAAIGSNEPYAFLADVVHVAAAAVWLGGAVMLIAVVLPLASFEDATAAVTRYSQIALGAVGALVATGMFQAWRNVGTLDALRTTPYGKLLITKVVLVAAIVGVAYLSRRTLQRRWAPASRTALRRTVAVEVAIAVCVLAVTSLLVNAVPAKVLAAAPQSGELTSATMLLDYTVAPARVGPNDIHLYTLTTAGQPQAVVEMTLKLSLPERGIAPITVKLQNAGPGHFQALDFDVPLPGKWRMIVTARTTEIDQEVFEGHVEIR